MADQYWDNVALAMPMDGVEGSTTFIDLKGKTVVNTGSVTHTTSWKKFGESSADFSGSNFLSVAASTDLAFGTGPFCIEMWIRPTTSFAAYRYLFDFGTNGGLVSLAPTTGKIQFYNPSTGTSGSLWNDGPNLSLDTAYFITVSRDSGGTTRLFVDGTIVASQADARNYPSAILSIGRKGDGSYKFIGQIDDLRITVGVPRETADFIPPTSSYFDISEGTIAPPLHRIEATGIVPIVGTGQIVPAIESVSGNDGAIIAYGEISPPSESISASGTSQAEPATNHAEVTPKLESIYGYGYTSVVGFGSIVPKRKGTISGSGLSGEWIGDGMVSPRLESISASGVTSIVGMASVNGKKGVVNGSGSSSIAGSGVITERVSIVSGKGIQGIIGSAQIQSYKDRILGLGTSFISGSAAITPPKENISASRYDKPSRVNLEFVRNSVITGTSPAQSVVPLHFTR